ncbi:MAG TPA: hypothetical protein VF155_12180, partial [Candidatus Dormibacteraeota bacterium]
ERGFEGKWESFLAAIHHCGDWQPLVRESIIDLAVITAVSTPRACGGLPEYLRATGVQGAYGSA